MKKAWKKGIKGHLNLILILLSKSVLWKAISHMSLRMIKKTPSRMPTLCHSEVKVSVYSKFDHLSKICFSPFQRDRIAIFHLKKSMNKH